MQKKISVLEAENATAEGLRSLRFSAPVQEIPVPEATERIIASDPGIDAPQFKCKHCKVDYESIQTLGDHIKAKHPNSQFKCEKCPNRYPFKSAMKNHMKLKHPISGAIRIRRFRFVRLIQKGKPVSYRRVSPSVCEVSPWESSRMS